MTILSTVYTHWQLFYSNHNSSQKPQSLRMACFVSSILLCATTAGVHSCKGKLLLCFQVVADSDPNARCVKEAWNAFVQRHRITSDWQIRGVEQVAARGGEPLCVSNSGKMDKECNDGQLSLHASLLGQFVSECRDLVAINGAMRPAMFEHLATLHAHGLINKDTITAYMHMLP